MHEIDAESASDEKKKQQHEIAYALFAVDLIPYAVTVCVGKPVQWIADTITFDAATAAVVVVVYVVVIVVCCKLRLMLTKEKRVANVSHAMRESEENKKTSF